MNPLFERIEELKEAYFEAAKREMEYSPEDEENVKQAVTADWLQGLKGLARIIIEMDEDKSFDYENRLQNIIGACHEVMMAEFEIE